MDTKDHTEITEERREIGITTESETVKIVEESVEVINVADAELRKIEIASAAQSEAIARFRAEREVTFGEETASVESAGQEAAAESADSVILETEVSDLEEIELAAVEETAEETAEESAAEAFEETAEEIAEETAAEIAEEVVAEAAEEIAEETAAEIAEEVVAEAAEEIVEETAEEIEAEAAEEAAEEIVAEAAEEAAAEAAEEVAAEITAEATEEISEEDTEETPSAAIRKIDENATVRVIGVRFKTAGKVYYFDPGQWEVKQGVHVIVETVRGIEYGMVVGLPMDINLLYCGRARGLPRPGQGPRQRIPHPH